MSKMRLHLDDLAVESFETTPQPTPRRGTVDAYATIRQGTCPVRYCEPTDAATCYYTCDDATCAATCANTCPNTCAQTCDDPSCANTCAYTCDDYTCAWDCGGTAQTDCFGITCADSCTCPF